MATWTGPLPVKPYLSSDSSASEMLSLIGSPRAPEGIRRLSLATGGDLSSYCCLPLRSSSAAFVTLRLDPGFRPLFFGATSSKDLFALEPGSDGAYAVTIWSNGVTQCLVTLKCTTGYCGTGWLIATLAAGANFCRYISFWTFSSSLSNTSCFSCNCIGLKNLAMLAAEFFFDTSLGAASFSHEAFSSSQGAMGSSGSSILIGVT